MFCPYCGYKCSDAAKFCANCGKQLPNLTSQALGNGNHEVSSRSETPQQELLKTPSYPEESDHANALSDYRIWAVATGILIAIMFMPLLSLNLYIYQGEYGIFSLISMCSDLSQASSYASSYISESNEYQRVVMWIVFTIILWIVEMIALIYGLYKIIANKQADGFPFASSLFFSLAIFAFAFLCNYTIESGLSSVGYGGTVSVVNVSGWVYFTSIASLASIILIHVSEKNPKA